MEYSTTVNELDAVILYEFQTPLMKYRTSVPKSCILSARYRWKNQASVRNAGKV